MFNKSKLIIYGKGVAGTSLYYILRSKYEFQFFVDQSVAYGHCSEVKVGLNVYNPRYLSEADLTDTLIVISSYIYKNAMADELVKLGLVYRENYVLPEDIDSQIFGCKTHINSRRIPAFTPPRESALGLVKDTASGRKLALVYGNCQAGCITRVLEGHRRFSDEYCIIEVPFTFESDASMIFRFLQRSGILANVDLFITQTVKFENGFDSNLSTECLLAQLGPKCRVVKIPNMYFQGYWPNFYPLDCTVQPWFYWGDDFVDNMNREGMKKDDILRVISNDNAVPRQEYERVAEQSIAELMRRESTLDIRISDFIQDNWRDEVLFANIHHPKGTLYEVFCDRLLEKLGFAGECCYDTLNELSVQCDNLPLYPSLIHCYNFPRKLLNARYSPNTCIWDCRYTFFEYCSKYIDFSKYCYCSATTPFLPGSEPAVGYWPPHVASSTLRGPKPPAEPDPNKTDAASE